MTEEARQFLEVKNGLHSAFGHWLFAYLEKRATDIGVEAITYVPKNLEEVNEREQNFGRAKALRDLIEEIPHIISEKMKELNNQEKS